MERPESGDETRHFPPRRDGESHYFIAINRSKRSIVIDLRSDAEREVFRRLVATVDVVLQNFRPSVVDRLGLG